MAFAAVSNISNVQVKRVAKIPTTYLDGVYYRSVGGIAVGKTKTSLFVTKASKEEDYAAFYYYPDVTTKPSNFAVFRLKYAGHANAMAIDNNNVYVTGWTNAEEKPNNQANNKHNNWILMIPRKTIGAMNFNQNGALLPKDNKDTEEVEGYSVLYPKVKKVAADGTVSYSDYTHEIAAITQFKSNGRFIIRFFFNAGNNDDEFFSYTTAKLETYNGKKLFVVSDDPKDIFIVKNPLGKRIVGQDICYTPECGFFITRWYGSLNKTRSVMFWCDIDNGNYTTKTINGKSYKYYEPAIIDIDKTNASLWGVKKYESLEIESVAIKPDGTMYGAFNVVFTDEYQAKYKEMNNGEAVGGDGVYRITHDGGQNFLLN